MNFNARPKDAEIYSVLLEGLSPVGFRPLPGGRKFFRDTRELTIIAELEKGRPSSDGTYRDVILGYFVRGTRNPMGPAFVYSQVYAHVLRAKNLEGRGGVIASKQHSRSAGV